MYIYSVVQFGHLLMESFICNIYTTCIFTSMDEEAMAN